MSAGLRDFSEYSSRLLQFSGLDGLSYSAGLQFHQFLFQVFGNRSQFTNYDWYHSDFHVSQLFFIPEERCKYLLYLVSSYFHSVVTLNAKIHYLNFFFFRKLKLILVFWPKSRGPFLSQSHREFYESHFQR